MGYLIKQLLPTKKVRRHTTDKPWVTDHFRNLINGQQYAFTTGNTTLFRSLRIRVIREAKTIRARYYHQRIRLLLNCDPRCWWKHTKAITCLGKCSYRLHRSPSTTICKCSAYHPGRGGHGPPGAATDHSTLEMCHRNPQPKVTPAPKIEDDLRPISPTVVLSKQLESIVGGWMLDLISDRLDIRQFGA